MKDSKTGEAVEHRSIVKHYWNFCSRRLGIVPALVATLAVLTFVSPPKATAQLSSTSTDTHDWNDCSRLAPSPTPNTFEEEFTPYDTFTSNPPPNGYGSPMLNQSGGQVMHWSWDGTHQIVACQTLGLYATYNGTESRSTSSFFSGGYGAAFQCVELIQRYAYARWGDLPSAWKNPTGGPSNASNHYFDHPQHFTAHNNGTTYLPAVGDIVVFGPVNADGTPNPNASAGHIAIIIAVDQAGGNVTVYEQNWGYPWDGQYSVHKLQLKVDSSSGATTYTIGNGVTGSDTFGLGPGGTTYRADVSHVIYGVLSDNGGSGGTTSQTDPKAPTGTQSCSSVVGPFITSYCDAPSVKINCGGAIGSRNDFSGIPINWTYTNGNTACDIVTYNFGFMNTARTCSFYLYVPNGFATTKIKATLSDGTQQVFDENPVSGWQHWFDATNITSLTFSDANGTTNQELAWGRTASWSIERLCNF